jgi:hypothetical protein
VSPLLMSGFNLVHKVPPFGLAFIYKDVLVALWFLDEVLLWRSAVPMPDLTFSWEDGGDQIS